MEPTQLLPLACAVFGASMLQAATGIGYGVIVGPIFLVALNGSEAIQISTIHNFLIALLLVPALRRDIDFRVLKLLAIGSIGGIVFGFVLQFAFDVVALKLTAAAMVAFVAGTLALDMRRVRGAAEAVGHSVPEAVTVGAFSGVMGGMLAMPGPLAATWMSVRGLDKKLVRATVLAFFIFAYGANIMFYAVTTSFQIETLRLSGLLVPPLVIGIAVGSVVSRRLSEIVFRRILLVVLLSTIAVLLLSLN